MENNPLFRKINIFLIIFILFFYLIFASCDDILNLALLEDPKNQPLDAPTNFISVLGDNTVSLSWLNPVSDYFNKVILLRKEGTFAELYDDLTATIIYEGSDTSFSDTSVKEGETYYYSIYSVNTGEVYSVYPAKTVKTIASFSKSIRECCFYLIGGSSSYASPFKNLISEIDAFDPQTNTVYPNVATLPTPRYSCAVASGEGKIFVFGGLDENRLPVSRVDVLDVYSSYWPDNVWSTANSMPLPRYSLGAKNLEGKIYVFGGSTNISIPWAAMTDYNHMFDPVTYNWITDESKIPRLAYKFMNFGYGAYGGTLIYGVGRYNGVAGFQRYLLVHNIFGNYSTNVNDPTVTITASNASVFYHKVRTDNTDFLVYFILGGCTDTNTYYEPLRTTTGGNLNAIKNCYFLELPNSTLDIIDTLKTLDTARAYAKAEYYGDYIYIFCGLQDQSPAVSNTYEIQEVPEDLDFTDPLYDWTEYNSNLNARYAFDITKVIE